MLEYLIKRTDGEWFDLQPVDFADVCCPTSFDWEPIDAGDDWRIRTQGAEISFIYEDAGIHVTVEGKLSASVADRIVQEICENIQRVTLQKGEVLAL
jgi:hypothetical protein